MSTNVPVIRAILKIFGPDSYDVRGRLNRAHLAKIIFNNPRKLKKMNSIVHPAVREDFIEWCGQQYGETYVIQESALLFETGSYKLFDQTILVTAPMETRIARVVNRDETDEASVKARIDKQMPDEEKLKLCDHVIQNDGRQSLIRQVMGIHQKVLDASRKAKS